MPYIVNYFMLEPLQSVFTPDYMMLNAMTNCCFNFTFLNISYYTFESTQLNF